MSERRRTPQKRRRAGLLSPGAAIVALMAAAGVIFVGVALLGGGGAANQAASQDPNAKPTKNYSDSQKPEKHVIDAAAAGPRVHFATTEIDMGVVPLATNVGYSFSFANVGTEKLRLGSVFVRTLQGC